MFNPKVNKINSIKSDFRMTTEKNKLHTLNLVQQFELWYNFQSKLPLVMSLFIYSPINNENEDSIINEYFYNSNSKNLKNYLPIIWHNFFYNNYNIKKKFSTLNSSDYWWIVNSPMLVHLKTNSIFSENYIYHKIKKDNWWRTLGWYEHPLNPANRASVFHDRAMRAYGVEAYQTYNRYLIRFKKKYWY